MVICDFCLRQREDGACSLGLRIPKRMSCREFQPGIEKFCANPADFSSPAQIFQMATFFGIKGVELKKITSMTAQEKESRSKIQDGLT